MQTKFIEIISKEGEYEKEKATANFGGELQFYNDGAIKSIIPISDILEVSYKKDGKCAVIFQSGGNVEISEHEYKRMRSILLGSENA